MTTTTNTQAKRNTEFIPECVGSAALFLNPLLEDPASASSSAELREQAALMHQAEEMCLNCPMMQQCLYEAVAKHDIAGFVAGTTQRQRNAMRSKLNVVVKPENLDFFAGVNSGGAVDHDLVIKMRRSNPAEPLESLAERLGCSLSTVKRHLRIERNQTAPARPKLQVVPPSTDQVMEAWREISYRQPTRRLRKVA
jgi:hypothetical protein